MSSYKDQLDYLRTWDKEVQIEGELAGRTVFLMHVHESNAPACIASIGKEIGGRVFDVVKPSDRCDQIGPEQKDKKEWARHWLFRVYVPPANSEHVFITSEIMERAAAFLTKVLSLDRQAVTRLLFANHLCNQDLVTNHPFVRGNAVRAPDGLTRPALSAWGLINGLIQELTGERMGYLVDGEQPTLLNEMADGKALIKQIRREIK